VSGMARELEEELYPFSKTKPSFQGLLIDYATEVSLVHLGLVYFVETSDEVMVKETGKMRGQWLSLAELTKPDVYSKLETWSQIVIDYIKKD